MRVSDRFYDEYDKNGIQSAVTSPGSSPPQSAKGKSGGKQRKRIEQTPVTARRITRWIDINPVGMTSVNTKIS